MPKATMYSAREPLPSPKVTMYSAREPLPTPKATMYSAREPLPTPNVTTRSTWEPLPTPRATLSSTRAPLPSPKATTRSTREPLPSPKATTRSAREPLPSPRATMQSPREPLPALHLTTLDERTDDDWARWSSRQSRTWLHAAGVSPWAGCGAVCTGRWPTCDTSRVAYECPATPHPARSRSRARRRRYGVCLGPDPRRPPRGRPVATRVSPGKADSPPTTVGPDPTACPELCARVRRLR